MKNLVLISLTIALLFTGSAMAFGQHKQRSFVDRVEIILDLSDEQTQQIDKIREDNKELLDSPKKKMRKGMMDFLTLDPDSVSYKADVATLATDKSANLKSAIIARGELRSQVYAILNSEQKAELAKKAEKMKKKFKKYQQR